MFNNGDKVVCIDDEFSPEARMFLLQFPVKDRIYVVRGMAESTSIDKLENKEGKLTVKGEYELAVYLIGLHNPITKAGHEVGFASRRFRPLHDIDVSEFYKEEVPVEEYATLVR